MKFNFQDKHALVTGAGKSVGRGLARALRSAGAVTYALSRTQADLDSLQEECPGIHTICIDIAADWEKTRSVVESLGNIDLLINNAGVLCLKSMLEVAEEDYFRVFNTNVKSVLNVSQVVARGMVERKQGGAIVNVSSMASLVAANNRALYRASKAALDQLTRCMAVELGPHQIRVNSINPTLIEDTKMAQDTMVGRLPKDMKEKLARTPLGKFAKVQDVVSATLYLLSDKADMINGATLPIDGGLYCA